jgi:sulfate permease, SulP family
VLMGFTTGAAVLIAASQFPTAVAAPAPDGGVVDRAWWALVHPGDWGGQATILAVVTVALVVGARRVHRLFPGVLVAVLVGLVWSEVADYPDAIIGDLPSGLPTLSLALPWSDIGMVLVPGIVIALVGFAEPAAIARTYAAADRQPWSADREFIASGVANLTSGISGGFPVGGSFARSSINRLAGARTRWSGGITGALVFAFLPFASVLEPLPRAVLGAIVVAAAASLIRIPTLVRLWAESLPQATVAWTTMVVTLVASPHVEWGVVSGIALAVGVHLWRELRIVVEGEIEGNRCMLRPRGVLWFGSANRIDDLLLDVAARHPEVDEVVVDLSGLGRVDYSGAMVLRRMLDEAEESGLTVEVRGLPPQSSRVVARYLRGRAVRRPGAGAPDRRPPTSRPRSGSDRPE